MSTTTKTGRLALAVEIVKRNGPWESRKHLIEMNGQEIAQGATETEARQSAVEAVAGLLSASREAPVFVRADDGRLWVSIRRGMNSWESYIVGDDSFKSACWGTSPVLGEHVGGTTIAPR